MKNVPRATNNSSADEKNVILIPIYNDWESVRVLLPRLADSLALHDLTADIILVDDGSINSDKYLTDDGIGKGVSEIQILSLNQNRGHQVAITLGLRYVAERNSYSTVVIMDADGEDNPVDVPRLLEKCAADSQQNIIIAKRTARSETFAFKTFYLLYKLLFRILTGYSIPFGNFAAIPTSMLDRLLRIETFSDHSAATILRSGLPLGSIDTKRGARITGCTKMNLVSLIVHGLSAISVFVDRVGVRLILFFLIIIIVLLAGMLTVLAIKIFSYLAIPGWTSNIILLLLSFLFQIILLVTIFALFVLNRRSGLPAYKTSENDSYDFGVEKVYPRG